MLPGLPGPKKNLRAVFEADVCDFVLNNMTYKPEYRAELGGKGARDLLVLFMNWRSRQVDPQPRSVHKARTLLANRHMADPRYAGAVAAIERQLAVGGNVNAHLSERILEGYEPQPSKKPKKLTRRLDLDMLLNDWGLHHLHLSTLTAPNGFKARTGPLLVAAFRPNDAYLIDIIEHGDWTNDHLVKAMVEEWPDAGLAQRLNGVTPDTLTADQRRALRNNGVNAPVNVNGVAYMPGLGFSGAGTTVRAARDADAVMLNLGWFCDQMEADARCAAKQFAPKGLILPLDTDLHFEVFPEGGYGIVEGRTGYRIRLAA
jgi:hypothetical protein